MVAGWGEPGERILDKTVRVWEAATGRARHTLEGHSNGVRSVAWSPDGASLASGSDDKTVRVWEAATGRARHTLEGHSNWVRSVAWSPDGASLASGSDDKTVRVWEAATGRAKFVLEGHQAAVELLAWSRDSERIASVGMNGEARLWSANTGQLLDWCPPLPFWLAPAGATFNGDGGGWETNGLAVTVWRPGVSGTPVAAQTLQASAKVILAGDSNAGKTCLARRLAEDCYEEGQTTTHGMQIWTVAPEKFHPDGAAPEGQSREVFLWDLGGQDEYQLVNQLFLHDSTVGLVLFDGTRGAVGMESAKAWNDRLQTRANPSIRKLLIRSKADKAGVVPEAGIEELRQRLGFRKSVAVSAALDGDAGVAELREELHHAIDWDAIAVTSRPASFQAIRDSLLEARQGGECVLYLADLERRLASRKIAVEAGALDTTLGHLSREGQVVDIRLRSGDRVIVLRVDVLSRYAGSLVQAGAKNARGVPVLEQDRILSKDMVFPGLKEGERLPRLEEKTVIECAVRLMIERGLCFDHQGLLIFPTLFNELAPREGALPPSAPVYYDFSGPIDNVYASLVARLAVSGSSGRCDCGRVTRSSGRAVAGLLACGGRIRRGADIWILFDASTSADLRLLFRDFVNDHLESEGVSVLTGLAFTCRECKKEFSEEDIRFRLDAGKDEISCQRCGTGYSLFAASETETPESRKALVAFKTDVEQRTQSAERKVAAAMAHPRTGGYDRTAADFAFERFAFYRGDEDGFACSQPLAADLRDELAIERLDYVVVSGRLRG